MNEHINRLNLGSARELHPLKVKRPKQRTRREGAENAFGLRVETGICDGLQPVGDGIGPTLEARGVLAVLEHDRNAPRTLRQRALGLARANPEMGGACQTGHGFIAICEAQGGFRQQETAALQYEIGCERTGRIETLDNRRLARLARLAGAQSAIAVAAPPAAEAEDLIAHTGARHRL